MYPEDLLSAFAAIAAVINDVGLDSTLEPGTKMALLLEEGDKKGVLGSISLVSNFDGKGGQSIRFVEQVIASKTGDYLQVPEVKGGAAETLTEFFGKKGLVKVAVIAQQYPERFTPFFAAPSPEDA